MGKTNNQRCWYQHEHFSPHSTRSARTVKLKLTLSLKQGGGGGTGRSQGLMTNQFFKKNSIVLVY